MTERETRKGELSLAAREAPARIWLNLCDEADCPGDYDDHERGGEITWSDSPLMEHTVEYVRADCATPPAEGPVVWIAREKGTQRALLLSTGGRPERVEHVDGSVDYFPLDGENLITLGTWVSDLGLGLAPGECKRVRLTVMEWERDG